MQYDIPETKGTDSKIVYVRSSDLAMNGEGKPTNFGEYHEKITKKSDILMGYYTHRHLWGSNSREMSEVFIFEKLGDIEDFFEEEDDLISSTWPDETQRKGFMEEMNKLFSGKHADYVYRTVPELIKSNQ